MPALRPWAEWIRSAYGLTVTSVYRSRTEQLKLWNNRRNNPYPVARPGTSKHERGLAFDMVGPDATLRAAGATWKAYGGKWGGDYGDPIHFEI